MSGKPNKIKILLYGEMYHAKAFCEQLENYKKGIFEPKYFDELTAEINYNEVKLIHLVSPPLKVINKLKKYKRPIFFHWIGTDVYRFINESSIRRRLKKFLIESANVKNLVVSDNLKNELEEFGIESTILPLTKLNFIEEIPPMPEKFSVLVYVPEKRWDFYNGDLMLELAKKMPDFDFYFLASGKNTSDLPNVFMHDFVEDMIPFYKKCSALLRITIHDGLSKMVLEALSYGRHVLWSESFPCCFKVKNIDECISTLTKLKENAAANIDGKRFVEKTYNAEKIMDDYYHLCLKMIK